MTDREKVINELTEIYDEAYDRWVHRQYIEDKLISLIRDNIPDALALLREQETTFVLESDRYQHYHCEKCGYVTGIIARMHKFCPECGRKVKWDD